MTDPAATPGVLRASDYIAEVYRHIALDANSRAFETTDPRGVPLAPSSVRIHWQAINGRWAFTHAEIEGYFIFRDHGDDPDGVTTMLRLQRDVGPTEPHDQWLTDLIGQHVPPVPVGERSPVTIRWDDDEQVSIVVEGRAVAVVSHESSGWDGMRDVINTAVAMAQALGLSVVTVGIPNL